MYGGMGGMGMQPGMMTPGMPMGGMGGMMYGTPGSYHHGNSLGMSGLGSDYGGPMVDPYGPTIARTSSLYTPSVYEGSRSMYEADPYDRERYYEDPYARGRSHYDDRDDYRYRRSSSRMSRRSRRRDYDDLYDRDYDREYYDDRYGREGGYRSRRYSSSGGYYPSSSSRSGRRREDMSFIQTRKGDVKVLRNGEERIGDKMRRLFGFNPKGVNVVRMKPGERLAAHMSSR